MPEKQNVEYKESWRDEYLKWICGFANAQGGTIYIGDIAFAGAEDEAACRARFAKEWDDDEIYMHFDEMKQVFPAITYEKISHCCGLFTLQ